MSAVFWWLLAVIGIGILGVVVTAIRKAIWETRPYPWAHETAYDENGAVISERWVEMAIPEEYVAHGIEELAPSIQKLISFEGWQASIMAHTADGKRGVFFIKQAGQPTLHCIFDIKKDVQRERATRETLAARGHKIKREYIAMKRKRCMSWFLPNQQEELLEVARNIATKVDQIGPTESLRVAYRENPELDAIEGAHRIKIRMPPRQRCQIPKD